MNGFPVVEEVFQRNEQQKHTAERGDGCMGVLKVRAVLDGVKEGKKCYKDGGEAGGGGNYKNREDKTSTKNRNQDSPCEKPPLPARIHPRKHFCIHHRV